VLRLRQHVTLESLPELARRPAYDPEWWDEIDSLFEPEPREGGPLPSLDQHEAEVIRGTALGRAPFTEQQPTRYVLGNREHPEARVAEEPWLAPGGAKLARAAFELCERQGIDLAVAVERVLAATPNERPE
jgi:hypothetical protein